MTYTTLRRLSVVAIVFDVACAFLALLWLAARVREYVSSQAPWPWWQDLAMMALATFGGIAAFSAAVLWTYLRKTRTEPGREARNVRERHTVRELELEVQRAELQKRLRDLTKSQ